jgi:hypothetical protein
MAEVIELATRRAESPRLLVAVDDPLYAMLPDPRSFEADGVRVTYVPASSLADPDRDADLWIGRYEPSAPGRRLLFQTMSGATYEGDERRRVWRGGELVHPGALLDFGVPATNERGTLRSGESAALLFMTPRDDGWHLRIRVTSPVLLVAHLPAPADRFAPPPRWLKLARRLLAEGGSP